MRKRRLAKPVGPNSPAHKQLRKLRKLVNLAEARGMLKCWFCSKSISNLMEEGVEHHRDHNHSNDALENRELAHRECHNNYHTNMRNILKGVKNED